MAAPKRSRHTRSKSFSVHTDCGAELAFMGSGSPIAGVRNDSLMDKQDDDLFADMRAYMASDDGSLPALLFVEEVGLQEEGHAVPRVSTAVDRTGCVGRFGLPGKASWSRQQQIVTRWKNWVASMKVRKAEEAE